VLFHVDDILATCKTAAAPRELRDKLIEEFSDVKFTEGTKHAYLGRNMDFSVPGYVSINMEGFVNKLLSDFGVEGTAASPAAHHLFLVRDDCPKLDSSQSV
jgi:uncharacterized protein with ATP-grasp and redox domains